jgi:hypothetical protein
MMPPPLTRTNAGDLYTRALLGFAALMQQCNPSWASCSPMPIAEGRALRVGNWAIGLDLDGHADQHFGRYANCNPGSRCVNCWPMCSAEVPAVDLSIKAGGCSALWIEADDLFSCQPRVTVRSFVPGMPVLSDVWTPTVSPVTGQLHLIATNDMRTAVVAPNGLLTIGAGRPTTDARLMECLAFYRRWKALMSMLPGGGVADVSSLLAMA